MAVFETLKERGFIAQTTNEELVRSQLNKGGCKFYIGFDATADSLHVGHLLQCIVMKHLQSAGNVPIVLLGTGTTLVGDPTGKTDMRKMLFSEEIEKNAEIFKNQISRFVNFNDGKAILVKNGDWLIKMNYIQFLRDVGCHFSVNRMLTAECFKSRLERGLSFLEFNYMLMQSYDFLKLYQDFDCTIQVGGDDQWSNIIGGVELVRRVEGAQVCGLTFTLLTTKEGVKMGKTQNGAIWLDERKCSVFDFYQYWRNIADVDVLNCLKLLTFVPMSEINAMKDWQGAQLNKAKELLAFEVTKLVHGEEAAIKASEAAKSLFGLNKNDENMPTTILNSSNFVDGKIGVLKLLVVCGLCESNSQARRVLSQGGLEINSVKILDESKFFEISDFENGLIIKKGKKTYRRVKLV